MYRPQQIRKTARDDPNEGERGASCSVVSLVFFSSFYCHYFPLFFFCLLLLLLFFFLLFFFFCFLLPLLCFLHQLSGFCKKQKKLVVEKYPLLNNKPALMRAYKATTSKEGGGDGDDWVVSFRNGPFLCCVFRDLLLLPSYVCSSSFCLLLLHQESKEFQSLLRNLFYFNKVRIGRLH